MVLKYKKQVFEIETPWPLNSEQKEALEALQAFYEDPSENQFTLSGYAGTGKSSLINIFHKFLKKLHVDPIYSAPTHRALAVIKQMNSEALIFTLAKLFGLRPQFNIETGDYSLEDIEFNQQGKPQLSKGDVLIIDEASMVNDTLYDFVQKNIKELKLKVIYCGDPAQIKPVKSSGISKVFLNNNGKIFSLTKVERTGDNPILWESTSLRQGHDFSRVTRINEEGQGVYYVNKSDLLSTIKFEFPELVNDGLHIRCLSGTNTVVQSSNNKIREILGYKGQINPGEILMGYDNFSLDYFANSYKIINSGDYLVLSVKESVRTVINLDFEGYEVKLKNILDPQEKPKSIFIVSNQEDSSKVGTYVNKIRMLNIEAEQYRKARNFELMANKYASANDLKGMLAFMKDHLNTQGNVFQKRTLDYGYAHSIHKSQGGTYKKIIILEHTINAFRDENLKQQLKYVAMSRATTNVFVLQSI